MIEFSIEDLVPSAGGDGGAASLSPRLPQRDLGDLLNAWSIECGHSIESELLLRRSRTAIARLLAGNPGSSPHDRRSYRALLRLIDSWLSSSPSKRP